MEKRAQKQEWKPSCVVSWMVHALLLGLLNSTRRAAAKWAKPFLKLEGLLELFSSLQDPQKPSASSSSWHGRVDKIRSRLSISKQKGVVKWAFKHWNLSSLLGGKAWRGGGEEKAQGAKLGVEWHLWAKLLESHFVACVVQCVCVCARTEQIGRRLCPRRRAGGRGEAALERCQLFHGLYAIRIFFFLPFLPIPAPKRTRTGWQEEHAEKDLTVWTTLDDLVCFPWLCASKQVYGWKTLLGF